MILVTLWALGWWHWRKAREQMCQKLNQQDLEQLEQNVGEEPRIIPSFCHWATGVIHCLWDTGEEILGDFSCSRAGLRCFWKHLIDYDNEAVSSLCLQHRRLTWSRRQMSHCFEYGSGMLLQACVLRGWSSACSGIEMWQTHLEAGLNYRALGHTLGCLLWVTIVMLSDSCFLCFLATSR